MALRADVVAFNLSSESSGVSSPRRRSWGRMVSLRNTQNPNISFGDPDFRISGDELESCLRLESSNLSKFSEQIGSKGLENSENVQIIPADFSGKVLNSSVDAIYIL